MIKYRIIPKRWVDPKITPVQVSRENATSVWLADHGARQAKSSQYCEYHDSHALAKARLLKLADIYVGQAAEEAGRAMAWRAAAESLTEPEGT